MGIITIPPSRKRATSLYTKEATGRRGRRPLRNRACCNRWTVRDAGPYGCLGAYSLLKQADDQWSPLRRVGFVPSCDRRTVGDACPYKVGITPIRQREEQAPPLRNRVSCNRRATTGRPTNWHNGNVVEIPPASRCFCKAKVRPRSE